MAVPTAYTENELRSYMLSTTKAVSEVVGLRVTDFVDGSTDVLLMYGVSAIVDATDIAKLRALAKVVAWRTVNDYLVATAYDFSADGGSYKLSQMKASAEKALELAEQAAIQAGYISGYAIEMGTLTRPYDPYADACASSDEYERIH